MNAVIEVDEIRQVIYAGPMQRLTGAIARPHRLQRRACRPDLRVTIHTCFGGRDVGKTGRFHGGMAVAAIQPHSAYVMRVAERHRLLARLRCPGIVVRGIQNGKNPRKKCQDENRAENRDARKRIGAAIKYLRHEATRASRKLSASEPIATLSQTAQHPHSSRTPNKFMRCGKSEFVSAYAQKLARLEASRVRRGPWLLHFSTT